jgi:hypothetical protein
MSSPFIHPDERFFKVSLQGSNTMPVNPSLYPSNDGLNNNHAEYLQFVYFIAHHAKEALVIDILLREVICNSIVYVRTNFVADQLRQRSTGPVLRQNLFMIRRAGVRD